VFFVWVSLTEHKWVTLGERRSVTIGIAIMAVGMLSGLYSNYQQGEQIRLARPSGNQYAPPRSDASWPERSEQNPPRVISSLVSL
jgi:hypothetical protein